MALKKKKHKFKTLKLFFILIILVGSMYLYGSYIEPYNVQVNDYVITTDKIEDNFNGFTIIHLSDIHYGYYFDEDDLKKLVKKINSYDADIVVITGDLIDKDTEMTTTMSNFISNQLSKINASIGKYAITGEDDTNFDEWENIISNGGFTNLNNSYDTIYNKGYSFMLIAGLSSFSDKESITNKNQKTENYLNSFETNGPSYKILLMHEPDHIDDFENNPYDLVLAGHSHGGIIKLLGDAIIKTDGAAKYTDRHYSIEDCELYVSNGIGMSDYKFRLFNSPSFNVYRLVNK